MAASAAVSPATGLWTQVSGPAGASINTPSSPITTISNLSTGTFVFRWTIQNGACGNTVFDEMTINVFNANAQIANAGPDQLLCFTGIAPVSATMAANAAIAPSVGTWTLVSGSGVIALPNSPTTTINNLAVGINIFRWTINNGTCGSTNDLVAIFVFSSSQTQANAGPDQQICSNAASVTLAGNSLISPATGSWSQVSGPNTLIFANATSPNTTVSGFVPGIYTLQWTVNNGPCATPILTTEQMLELIKVFVILLPALPLQVTALYSLLQVNGHLCLEAALSRTQHLLSPMLQAWVLVLTVSDGPSTQEFAQRQLLMKSA
jgi:hypothetical protein